MNLYLFLSALRARFDVFALVLVVTVLAATVASVMLPKSYRATTAVLVDSKEEQSFSTASHPFVTPQERVSYLQTQKDIIASDKIARRVVRDLNLAQNPKLRAEYEEVSGRGTIEDWLAGLLQADLDVDVAQSNVIRITYTAHDALAAARVANAFAQAYIDTMLELRVAPTREAAAWFDEQLKGLRKNLATAQTKLSEYRRKHGIVTTDERLNIENTRLAELSSQLARAQEETFGYSSRQKQASGLIERGVAADRLPEVMSNPYIQRLKGDLATAEARLEELSTQYGPNYPSYRRQASEVRALHAKIDAEMAKVVAGIRNAEQQSQRREDALRAAMARQRAHVLDLGKNHSELTVLMRNAESAERAYDAAMQRFVVSQVESHANQADVTLLSPAVAPPKPYRPKLVLNIVLAVIVGTMIGIGIVILLELLDRRVRSRNDLEPDVPVLMVLNEWQPTKSPLLGGPSGAGRALPSPG